MFSPALGRVVRSSGSISTPSVCTLGRPVALGAVQQPFSRCPHQRRLSSSKASIPPDDSKGPNSEQQTPGTNASKAPTRKVTGRAGKKRSTTRQALNVPHVPPTDYLQKPEVKISSFFSLHRPISLASDVIPPVSTPAKFETIFQPRSSNSRKTVIDNIQTLSGSIDRLEAALRSQEQKEVQEDAMQSEAIVQHLEGPPQASIDDLMSQFVPFRAPPAPVPFDQAQESETVSNQMVEDAALSATPIQQRVWKTAVIVTESMDASGKRTYSATTSPMEEIQVPGENGQEMDEPEIRQPFLERMRHRQNTNTRVRESQRRPDMLLISVKRQRKLKMKKHKYKKLMKKTRLLRRKLDRL